MTSSKIMSFCITRDSWATGGEATQEAAMETKQKATMEAIIGYT